MHNSITKNKLGFVPIAVALGTVALIAAIFLLAPTQADADEPGNATIHAEKIICDDEQYLPNGQVSNPITFSTATEWLGLGQNSDHCWLDANWDFEWRYGSNSPWNLFSMSNPAIVQTNLGRVETREVWDDDYIPFTGTSGSDVTAEFYCASDVTNYDNLEWLTTLVPGEDYYCIGFNVPEPYCGDGEVQIPNHQGQDEDCDGEQGCSDECTWEPATVNTQKVVCDDEQYLPNWGTGGSDINTNTVTNFLATGDNNLHCQVDQDWQFEWSPDGVGNPGDNTVGPAGLNWTPFTGSVDFPAFTERVWFREIWNNDYIPFTYSNANNDSDNISAEFYCNDDVFHYDNWEWIDNLQPGQPYYCVGFNVEIPVCGNNRVQPGEQCDDGDLNGDPNQCNAECTDTTTPVCGNTIVEVGEECDGTKDCNVDCTLIPEPVVPQAVILEPVLAIDKVVGEAKVGPSDTVTYTVTVTNNGDVTALNVSLEDILPGGFLFSVSGTDTNTWDLGDIAVGEDVIVTYDVVVGKDVADGTYENLAVAYAENYGNVSDKEPVKVEMVPVVLGEEAPALTITKTNDAKMANPNQTVNYEVVVTNVGGAPAMNAMLHDTLDEGLVFAGTATETVSEWELGDLVPSESVTIVYEVTVLSNATDGVYNNIAVASADDVTDVSADADLEVVTIKVLGAETPEELPVTGAGMLTLLTAGAVLLGTGLISRKRTK